MLLLVIMYLVPKKYLVLQSVDYSSFSSIPFGLFMRGVEGNFNTWTQ